MKQKKDRVASAVYISLSVLLVALLVYALYHAMAIYIPQKQEESRYKTLRNAVSSKTATEPASSEQYGSVQDVEDSSSEAQSVAHSHFERNKDSSDSRETADSADTESVYAFLYERNRDFSGWLKIDDTDIDYPVMKSSEDDPEYYLHRDFDRQESYSGSLFIGGGCNADSNIFVIYGHNMDNDAMFGTLSDYRDAFFTDSHSEIIFDTLNEHRVYRVFSAFETQIHDEDVDVFKYNEAIGDFSQREYSEIVDHLRSLSLFGIPASPKYPQQILLLSTCSYHTENGRFVVAAYRVE